MLLENIVTVSKSDLAAIAKYRPLGAEPLTAAEVASIPILVADTTIDLAGQRWDKAEIEKMVELVVGNVFMPDHAWDEVMGVEGKIFKAAVARVEPTAPFVDAIGLRRENLQAAVSDGGIWACIAWAYVPADSPWLDKIRFGAQDISLGGFWISHLECPACRASFSEPGCTHVPKTAQMRDPAVLSQWEAAGFDVVPYAQMRGLYVSSEVSLVFAGMNTSAQVVTEDLAKHLTLDAPSLSLAA